MNPQDYRDKMHAILASPYREVAKSREELLDEGDWFGNTLETENRLEYNLGNGARWRNRKMGHM